MTEYHVYENKKKVVINPVGLPIVVWEFTPGRYTTNPERAPRALLQRMDVSHLPTHHPLRHHVSPMLWNENGELVPVIMQITEPSIAGIDRKSIFVAIAKDGDIKRGLQAATTERDIFFA